MTVIRLNCRRAVLRSRRLKSRRLSDYWLEVEPQKDTVSQYDEVK
jgi:hypothetical protein